MDNIKFKAVRKDSGETFDVLHLDWIHSSVFLSGHMIEVDMDCVSLKQFTGVTLPDGTDLYEGDIVKSYHFTERGGVDKFIKHTVEWSNKFCGWYMRNEDDTGDGVGSIQLWTYLRSSQNISVVGYK